MKCLICDVDISKPEQQFGDVRHPVCMSHYLDDMAYFAEYGTFVAARERGLSFAEALEQLPANLNEELSLLHAGEELMYVLFGTEGG